MLTAIVGTNWGDEGKGRMVDLLSARYDIVARYQGGNNAGHTVVNERGKFILNLLPSGILRDETVNVMGPGMVVDIEHLTKEIQTLRDRHPASLLRSVMQRRQNHRHVWACPSPRRIRRPLRATRRPLLRKVRR